MKKEEKLSLTYVLGMPIVFIIANFIARVHFSVVGSPLYFSVLLYPLTYLFSGMVIKKTNYKNGLLMMAITLMLSALTFVVEWALLDTMDYFVMIYAFLSFLICQLIFIYTYDFLRKIKKDTYGWVFILVAIVSAIDSTFFGAMIEGQLISLSVLVRIIYAVAIPVFLARSTAKK